MERWNATSASPRLPTPPAPTPLPSPLLPASFMPDPAAAPPQPRYAHHTRENPKTAHYLSMEFLQGRALLNAVGNIGMRGASPRRQRPACGLRSPHCARGARRERRHWAVRAAPGARRVCGKH